MGALTPNAAAEPIEVVGVELADSAGRLASVIATGDLHVVVLPGEGGRRARWTAVRADGTIAWTADHGCPLRDDGGWLEVDSAVILCAAPRAVLAVDGRTGATAWERAVPAGVIAADADLGAVAVADAETVRLLDITSGVTRGAWPMSHQRFVGLAGEVPTVVTLDDRAPLLQGFTEATGAKPAWTLPWGDRADTATPVAGGVLANPHGSEWVTIRDGLVVGSFPAPLAPHTAADASGLGFRASRRDGVGIVGVQRAVDHVVLGEAIWPYVEPPRYSAWTTGGLVHAGPTGWLAQDSLGRRLGTGAFPPGTQRAAVDVSSSSALVVSQVGATTTGHLVALEAVGDRATPPTTLDSPAAGWLVPGTRLVWSVTRHGGRGPRETAWRGPRETTLEVVIDRWTAKGVVCRWSVADAGSGRREITADALAGGRRFGHLPTPGERGSPRGRTAWWVSRAVLDDLLSGRPSAFVDDAIPPPGGIQAIGRTWVHVVERQDGRVVEADWPAILAVDPRGTTTWRVLATADAPLVVSAEYPTYAVRLDRIEWAGPRAGLLWP